MELIFEAVKAHTKEKKKLVYVRGQAQTEALKRAKHVYYLKNKTEIAEQSKALRQRKKQQMI